MEAISVTKLPNKLKFKRKGKIIILVLKQLYLFDANFLSGKKFQHSLKLLYNQVQR